MLSLFQSVCAVVSGFVLLIAFLPYWKAIKAGDTKPKKATWFVWTVGDLAGLIGQIAEGTATVVLAGAVLFAARTFFLSLKRGESGWTVTDKICLALSGFALVMWQVMKHMHMPHAGNYAVAFSMLALVIGALPTWKSSWWHPEHEDLKSWKIFTVSSLIAMFAIKQATFADIVVPSTFLFIDGVTLWIVIARRKALGRGADYDFVGTIG